MKIDKKILDSMILNEVFGVKSPGQAISDSLTQVKPTNTLKSSELDKKESSNTIEVDNSSVERIKAERDKILDYIDNLRIEDLQRFKNDVNTLIDLLGFVDRKKGYTSYE